MPIKNRIAMLVVGDINTMCLQNLVKYFDNANDYDLFVCYIDKPSNIKNVKHMETITGNKLKTQFVIEQSQVNDNYEKISTKTYVHPDNLNIMYNRQKLLMLAFSQMNAYCVSESLHYDFIIKINSNVSLNARFTLVVKNTLNVVNIPQPDDSYFNDDITFGSYKNIDKYTSCFKNFKRIDQKSNGNYDISCDGYCSKINLNNCKIGIEYVQINYDHV